MIINKKHPSLKVYRDKGARFVPNMVTSLGLAAGLLVLFNVHLKGDEPYLSILSSVLLLLFAAVADFLDGALARAMKAESLFGLLFDSMSDAITFGVAPAVVVVRSLELVHGSAPSAFFLLIAIFYVLCGVLRLVRYNIASSAFSGEKSGESRVIYFTGLPIPSAAIALLSLMLILFWKPCESALCNYRFSLVAFGMFALAVLMVSRLRFPKIKSLRWKKHPAFGFLILGALVLFFFYGAIYFFPVALFIFAWSYVILAPLAPLFRLPRPPRIP